MAHLESFILNRKSYRYKDLLDGKIELKDRSEFELETLGFIKDWLEGREHFQLETSGSTGKPKKISFTRKQIMLSAQRSLSLFQLTSGQTALTCLNTRFAAGMMMLARAMTGNLNLIVTTPEANPLVRVDTKQTIDFCAMTPYQVQATLDESPSALARIKTLLIGGSPLNPTLEDQLQKINSDIFHSYAMTETLTHVAIRKVDGKEKSDIFHAIHGISFLQDDRGCLIINDTVLEIDKLITNDIVELVNERSFKWKGRLDQVVNSGGIKIRIEETENKIIDILGHAGISQPVCLIAIPDEKLTHKLVLLIEEKDAFADARSVLNILKRELPRYHNPKVIQPIPEILLTKSGKIDRKRNAETYLRYKKPYRNDAS